MPFPKPDKLPRWATEFINNGPNHTPNVQEPPEAKKDFGWNFLEKPPRQWVNWLALKAYQWLLWSEESIDELYMLIPPGVMVDYAGINIPSGWLGCDGSEVSRTTYAALFTEIGTIWGAGDGSTTFNLPDYRSRSSVGTGQGAGLTDRVLGTYGGEETHTLSKAEIPPHTHQYLDAIGNVQSGNSAGGVLDISVAATTSDGREGGLAGLPHNNMQPFAVATKIIKF